MCLCLCVNKPEKSEEPHYDKINIFVAGGWRTLSSDRGGGVWERFLSFSVLMIAAVADDADDDGDNYEISTQTLVYCYQDLGRVHHLEEPESKSCPNTQPSALF